MIGSLWYGTLQLFPVAILLCTPFFIATFTLANDANEADHASHGGTSHTRETPVEFTQNEIQIISSMGPWPQDIPPDPGNELSGSEWAETLGEQLFFDPSLSGTGTISCASCHLPELGFADGISLGKGVETHIRNSPGLLNIGLQKWFGWDGGADSLWAASIRPMLSDIEMGGDIEGLAASLRSIPSVTQALKLHKPNTDIADTSDEDLFVFAAKAIAAYTRTLISQTTAFDDFRLALLDNVDKETSYSESAKRGLKIFVGEANCFACHFGPNFSNGEFHDIGRPFFTGVGQVDPGRHTGIKRVRQDRYNLTGPFNRTNNEKETLKTQTVTLGQVNFGQWRTPTLRNLTLTAPYMHDGSLATLRDVVDFYAEIDVTRLHSRGESILKPLQLDESGGDDLANFLKSLTPVD